MNSNQTRRSNNVDWFDQTPDSWGVGKLYQYCRLTNGSTPSRKIDEYWENGTIPWMSSGEVNKKLIDHIDVKISESGFKNSSVEILPVGTVMMGLNGQGKTKGTVGLLRVESTCNQSLCGMIPYEKLSSEFLYFYLESQYRTLRGLVGEGQREGISVSFLSRYPVVIPPLEEQKLISRYLDKKTEQIDYLIEKIQKKIELLKEQRTSLINQCVTKGLDPNVEMKDSGVEWIGEIPKHWDTKRLKYFLSYTKGFAFKSDVFEDEGIPIVKASDVKKGTINNPNVFLDPGSVGTYHKVILQTGDIIISTVGSQYSITDSAVGQVAMVPEELDGSLLNQNTVFVRLTEEFIDRKFLFYTFLTRHFRSHLDVHSHGTANQASLNVEDILNYSMIFPGLPEQKEIVFSLERNLTKVDRSIDLGLRRTNLLREYRQSLISSVVTGKVRVTEDMT